MKLVTLKLKNFRCYQKETAFLIDDLTSIIGRNDIGKSTILDALDAFFNNRIEQNDLSNTADNSTIEITCCFEGIPDQIINDYNGFLVKPKDPNQIAQKILYLLNNPKKAKIMGLRGREIVLKKFNFKIRTKKIISLYNHLIKPKII